MIVWKDVTLIKEEKQMNVSINAEKTFDDVQYSR